jgi:hypothetical protein
MRRETVDRMIRAVDVADVLARAGKPLPLTEYALRPLAPFLGEPSELVEVYSRAEEMVPAGGTVTSTMLERVIHSGDPDRTVDATGTEVIKTSCPGALPEDVDVPVGGVDPETDWDAFIRGEIAAAGGSSAGGGGGGDVRELTQGQRLSRLTKLMERIEVLAGQAHVLADELDQDVDAADDDRAVALNEATGGAAVAMDQVAGVVQAWFSGDEAGLPEPDITPSDFPVEFKY